MIKSENINELATALVKAQAAIGGVKKASKAHTYSYANLEAVIDAVKEPLNNNNLSFVQLIGQSNEPNTVKVTTLLIHGSGQYIGSEGTAEIPEMKGCNLTQRQGSAQSYLKRYQLQALTGLPTEDNDASSEGFVKQTNNTSGLVTISSSQENATVIGSSGNTPPKLTDAQANATVKAPSFSRNKPAKSTNDLGI